MVKMYGLAFVVSLCFGAMIGHATSQDPPGSIPSCENRSIALVVTFPKTTGSQSCPGIPTGTGPVVPFNCAVNEFVEDPHFDCTAKGSAPDFECYDKGQTYNVTHYKISCSQTTQDRCDRDAGNVLRTPPSFDVRKCIPPKDKPKPEKP